MNSHDWPRGLARRYYYQLGTTGFFLFPLTFRARVHTRITRVRALCTRWFRSLQSGTDHLVRDPLIRDKQIRFTPYDLLLYVSIFRLQCTEYLWTPQNPLSQVPEKRGKKRKEKKRNPSKVMLGCTFIMGLGTRAGSYGT